jgi:hypothetical protein
VKKNKHLNNAAVRLEYALEKFPVSLKLRDGTEVVIRPVSRRDGIPLHKFLVTAPEEERLFIKKPVFARALFREWLRQLDFEEIMMLLMLHGHNAFS